MAKNTTMTLLSNQAPTLISDTAITAARVQSQGAFYLLATTDTTQPTNVEGGIFLPAEIILAADLALADLFPGVGSSVYLWAWPTIPGTKISISHV